MNKAYLFVKPSSFVRLGDINIDGEFEYVSCNNFIVKDPKENYLIFEVRYTDYVDGREYDNTCRELVSGKRFDLDIETRVNRKTKEETTTVVLGSDEIGLYSDVLPLKDVLVKPSRAAGLIDHFQSNPSSKKYYCKSLKEMIEEARAFKHIYDTSIEGPSRYLVGQMKKTYRRTN